MAVLRVILHDVGSALSGELECQVTMEVRRKESVVLVPGLRSHRITVLDRQADSIEVRVVEAGEGLQCEAEGFPAPHISWHSLGEEMAPLSEDKVESLALRVETETGLQVSREIMYRVEQGEFGCRVLGRDGAEEVSNVTDWSAMTSSSPEGAQDHSAGQPHLGLHRAAGGAGARG